MTEENERNKIIFIWVKPKTSEKIEKISNFCHMTKGELIENTIEGIDNRFCQDVERLSI